MGENGEHAFDAKRFARVDARDATPGDGRGDDAAIGEAAFVELAGILRRAGDLGAAVDAGDGLSDVAVHGAAHAIFFVDCDCGVPCAACESVRTIARRARSILKSLWVCALAPRSSTPAARAKAALVGLRAPSTASAAVSRHGLWATPPSARRASDDPAAVELERGGDRDEGERVGGAVADLQVGVVLGEAFGGQLDRRDELVRCEVGVEVRRVAGQAMELGERDGALAAGPATRTMALERGERDAHVGGVGGDAGFAGAEDRVVCG